jgi:hypothetical protein
VLAIDRTGEPRPVLVGVTIDASGGRVIRRVRAPLGRDADRAAVVLARSLLRGPPRGGGRWLKWTLASTSLLAMGAGASLIHLDGRCRERMLGRPCRVVWRTGVVGWAALGTGVALGAASAYLFWRDARPRERRVELALLPRTGGVGVMAGFEF